MINYNKTIARYIPENISDAFRCVYKEIYKDLREITISVNKPMILYLSDEYFFINKNTYKLTKDKTEAFIVSSSDLNESFLKITDGAPYSCENTIAEGFITLDNGSRVGICGKGFVDENGAVKFPVINHLSFRISRDICNISNVIMRYIFNKRTLYNTLIISPPCSGKTTLIRDIVRQISNSTFPVRVGVADERSEISVSDLGAQSIVIEGINKQTSFDILTRTLSPDVIVTDELGGLNDYQTVFNATRKGVKVIATSHGESIEDVKKYSGAENIINIFDTIVILSPKKGKGEIMYVFHKGEKIDFT